MILVTGGAGFIGTNFVLEWFKINNESIINIDKISYVSNISTVQFLLKNNKKYFFSRTNLCNQSEILSLFKQYKPRAVIHLAAESHVDCSIKYPNIFIKNNILSTSILLEITYKFWKTLSYNAQKKFRFLYISTDEVYGSLKLFSPLSRENSLFQPNNPYAASKASSEHLIHAYFHTYGLPVITIRCSNNYGPYQFPEKLISMTIYNLLNNQSVPIYGDGNNIRDWLYVGDNCSAIRKVLEKGKPGSIYNVSSYNEKTNLAVIYMICQTLQKIYSKTNRYYYKYIIFVTDRLGHDRRYAINSQKIRKELGWYPSKTFYYRLTETIHWYLNNKKLFSKQYIN